jgi:3-oxoacyl-[acyl-carrier protein] reductase
MASPKALILGGKGGIGSAISRRFAAEGYTVIAVGRDEFDLADPAAIDDWFAANSFAFDVLVHSAGVNHPAPFTELDMTTIEAGLEANLMGFLRVLKHVVPGMTAKHWGRITVMSSLYGFLSRRGRITYAMAKHALNGAVKTLAIELGPQGILVNSVAPGFVMTDMTRTNNDDATIQRLVSGIPLGRMAEPEEIADVVYFVSSAQNRYLTGQDLVVDGGFSVGGFQE